MSLRPYYAIAHVASQIMGRYLSVNAARNIVSQESHAIEAWTRKEWDDFISRERRDASGLLPWLNQYFVKADPEGDILLDKVDSHLTWCRKVQAHYCLLCDPLYPDILRQIPQAPMGFSLLGNTNLLKSPKISVVGSRRTANIVLQECYQMGYLLSRLGITTVSGGAFGCDIATHTGVLHSSVEPLPAIVVFANGLKNLYPQGNRDKFMKIYDSGGLLLSERLWDQLPKPYDFPVRNRIISGLSMCTLVMGATKNSGAMITARFALDQGRDVSVFFPDREHYFCEGSQFLIDDGARYFTSAKQFCNQFVLNQ